MPTAAARLAVGASLRFAFGATLRFAVGGLAVVATIGSFSGRADAQPVLGQVESWSGTSRGDWSGGSTIMNPGTGGVDGSGDGFLLVSNSSATALGVRSFGNEYIGDWIAAGITHVQVWLRDVGVDDPLEIHFSIGNRDNFWQYDPSFEPPTDVWVPYVVDLTRSDQFTHIIDAIGESFEDALRHVDRVHLRYDLAPYGQSPDPIAADFGMDELFLANLQLGTEPSTWGRIKALYRP